MRIGEAYTTWVYIRANERACQKAGVPHWTPNQLRHAAGTQFCGEHGLDVAQKLLGHKNAMTTERYARVVDQAAAEAAGQSG